MSRCLMPILHRACILNSNFVFISKLTNQTHSASVSLVTDLCLLSRLLVIREKRKNTGLQRADQKMSSLLTPPPSTSYCSLFLCLSHHPTPTTKKNQQRLLVRSSEMTPTCMYLCLHLCISLVLASQILSKTDVFLCAPPRLSLFLEYIILMISHKHDPPSFFSSPASSLSVLMK